MPNTIKYHSKNLTFMLFIINVLKLTITLYYQTDSIRSVSTELQRRPKSYIL